MLSMVYLQTRAKTYDPPTENYTEKEPPSSQLDASLHMEKNLVIRPPKSTLKKTTHNPNAKVAQHYSIVEYSAQD